MSVLKRAFERIPPASGVSAVPRVAAMTGFPTVPGFTGSTYCVTPVDEPVFETAPKPGMLILTFGTTVARPLTKADVSVPAPIG